MRLKNQLELLLVLNSVDCDSTIVKKQRPEKIELIYLTDNQSFTNIPGDFLNTTSPQILQGRVPTIGCLM
jgi:hypothetical protein